MFREESVPEEEEEALEEIESELEEESIPVSRVVEVPLEAPRKVVTQKAKPRQGYYVLDPATNTPTGIRKYVYYGPSPPPE